MAVKFTTTHIKMSTTTFDFFKDSSEFTQYIIETYVKTNKCLEWRKMELPDSDTMILASTWSDMTTYLEALDDPIVIQNIQARDNYYIFDCGAEITVVPSLNRD